VALTVGLQAAAQSPVAGTAEASVRALAKIVQVLPTRLRRRADALRAVTVPAAWTPSRAEIDPEVLTAVAQACRDTERLRFGYTTASGEAAERFVEPFRLVALGRRWYLVAYDVDRGDWRSFRLDRLSSPRATGARFAQRTLPGGDAAEFVRAGITARQATQHVAAEVRAPADDVRARIGQWSTVEPTGPNTCRVHMEADDLSWPALALGMVGAEFTLTGPPELQELLGEWGRRFARAAAQLPATDGVPAAT
jgi:predicted DNA-binding transcriptional regulator YafY